MLKVIELFAGVGSQTQALKNIGVEHEVVGIAEIDKYAISSYMQLHGDTPLLGDISKIDSLPNADLWTYSFPCQDLSVAGKGAGIKEGTRSGLLFEVERLLEVSNKPKYLLMENVKNLVGKKNKPDFDRWCQKLEELGYKNHWQVLNAKDYGVPQNRERVFMVSILDNGEYKFPEKEVLNIRLKDVLEREVEEKYYLSEEYMDRFLKSKPISSTDIKILGTTVGAGEGTNCRHWVHDSSGIVGALSATDYKQPKQVLELKIIRLGEVTKNSQAGQVYSANGLSQTICAGTHGYAMGYIEEQKILVKNATKKGYLEATPGDYINLQFPDSETRRGRVQKEISATLMCNDNNGVLEQNFRIRKLTPRECWRLMGWKDEEFNKIQGISNSQLYKQAGNGIVVNVLERIFENLFKGWGGTK